ncbi:unnamed protein product [Fusarium equiseti]|uniref:Ankyrin repeat protein n=1 Tax=Fusarium equiseti TaxID=61235 RepID=A0A8J2NLP8_FUSEQ|nr:unnamed protein product [Fusarium equiseti]
MSPALLRTIHSLKDSTFEACAAISAHLKTSSASKSSETDLNAPKTDSVIASKLDIKHLVVELRLLGGALYSLESFITELTADDTSGDSALGVTPSTSGSNSGNEYEPEWPMIDRCEIVVSALKSFHAHATSDGVKAARALLSDVRSKLAFVLGSSDTLEDISVQFSILTTDAVPQLMVQKKDDLEDENPEQSHYDDGKPTTEDVSNWLDILNSYENDREPAEYNREAVLLQSRRITEPKYRVAAARWPEYAQEYWQTLRPQVCTLFRIEKSYNFVQWVLEYARVTYPRTLGPLALSPRLLLELTDALCDGSISPLHVAAALGLPSLCQDLLLMGADVNQFSLIGTPLFCALVGSKVLVTRAEPESWTTLLAGGDSKSTWSNSEQASTALHLLNAGADCTYRYTWKNGTEEASLAGLAFWNALLGKNEAIFMQIVQEGNYLDSSFRHFLKRENVTRRGLLHRTRFARLLTYVYDLTLLDIENDSTEYVEIQDLVSKLMKHANVKFAPTTEKGKIYTLSEASFEEAIRTAILDFNVTLLERLIKDPRFDPNFPYNSTRDAGTILHMATEGAQLDIMDLLINAGADIRARDSSGRTPLMVVEEVGPLARLIHKHSAPTFDTDNGGRNIWHLLAATNDVDMLKFLWENDPHKIRNLDAVCKEEGHTPLRAAFAYVNTLQVLPKGSRMVGPLAARFLLEKRQGSLQAEDPEQLARWAVEWGDCALLERIFQLAPTTSRNNETILRALNISASSKLVSLVLGRGGPSRPFHDGVTPAETVITNTKLSRQRLGFTTRPSAHPSCFPNMTRDTYMQLLTPEVLSSKDNGGRGLWARFCDDVLPMVESPSADQPTNMYFLHGFVRMAISCLLHKGALLDHEKETGEWAIARISKKARGAVTWTPSKLPFIAAVLEAAWDENQENPQEPSKAGSSEFFKSRDAAVLLAMTVTARKPEIVKLLVQSGINVHKPWESFGGRSIFEDFLADEPIDVSMIKPLLSNTKPQDIIENQHYTFREILCIEDEKIATDIVDQLIDCGMDVNNLKVSSQPSFRSPCHESPGPSMLVKALCRSRTDVARLLIRRGADASLAPPDHINGFMLAAKIGNVVVLETIIERASPGFDWLHRFKAVEYDDIYNALQFAAVGGHRDVLMALLEATPLAKEVNTVSPVHGKAPAHLAAKAGSLDCIKVLTRFGANLLLKDSSGRTPAFLSMLGRNREMAEYINDRQPGATGGQHFAIPEPGPESSGTSSDIVMGEASDDSDDDPENNPDQDSDPEALGDMVSHAIDHYQLKGNGLFRPFLDLTSKQDLESAIMPCGDCTLLSYTASRYLVRPMIELLDLGFKGFVTCCLDHWPDGYNALLQAAADLYSLMAFDMFMSPEKAYTFFEKCLDAYLEEERLWFHLKVTPIHALFNNKQLVPDGSAEHQANVLQIFIKHLQDNAEKYWALMEKFGLVELSHFHDHGDVASRVLRIVLNIRTELMLDNTITGATPLHSMVQFYIKKDPATINYEQVCKMAKLLIDCGTDIDAQDDDSNTALHFAAQWRLVPLVDLLLERGANPYLLDEHGLSPLASSFVEGKLDSTHVFFKHGFDLRSVAVYHFDDWNNFTLDIMHVLLQHGLDPLVPDSEGNATLTTMISQVKNRAYALNGDFDFYRLAEEQPGFLAKSYYGLYSPAPGVSPLKAMLKCIPKEYRARVVNYALEPFKLNVGFLAIREDHVEELETLIEAGFDIECDGRKGSALMYACSVGAFECVKLLVRRGARVSYLGVGTRGEPVVRSAPKEAERFPKLVQWLLVGRYLTRCLTEKEHNGPDVAIKPWSGPRPAAYRWTGIRMEFPRLRSEKNEFGYLDRIADVREGLQVGSPFPLPVTLVE